MPIDIFYGRGAAVIAALMLASACGARPKPDSQPQKQTANEARAASELQPPQPGPQAGEAILDRLRLPPGFSIELYTDEVPNARSIALGPDGIVYVGTRDDSRIYAVLDQDGDRDVDQVITLLSGLDTPNGIAYRDGDLYVAEPERILRYPDIDVRLDNPPSPSVVSDAFPGDPAHGWRYLRSGPDGYLYIGVGAPCNACMRNNPIYASIARLRPDGSDLEVFAHGVRNTVGFDWHPDTKELWFTDNGRDGLGDNVPPDELNRAPTADLHFGYPHCHGGEILDPVFGEGRTCAEFEPPVQKLGPHVAALGMRFYTGDMFPEQYRRAIIIAEHGSWDRSEPIGYRVMVVPLAGNEPVGYLPLVEGFLDEETGEAWGRPVDVAVLGDGSLLVSDDEYGALYRVTYE
jgi:glucose/arabinose dehydrogenase